jgi:RecA-family ATPase
MYTEEPADDYLIEGLIELGIPVLLEAGGGGSKTMFSMQMQLSVATGRPLCGYWNVGMNGIGSSVGIYSEDAEKKLHQRLRRMVAQMGLSESDKQKVIKRVVMRSTVGEYNPVVTRENGVAVATNFVQRMLNAIESIDDLKLVIIDPLAKHFSADFFKIEDANFFWATLVEICLKKGATIIVLNHVNKVGLKDGITGSSAGYGSVGFGNAARITFNMATMNPKASDREYGVPETEAPFYVQFNASNNNYLPPSTSAIWLKRGNYGVLEYAPDIKKINQPGKDKGYSDYIFVLTFIKDEAAKDHKYTKTQLAEEHVVTGKDGVELSKAKKLKALQYLEDNDLVTLQTIKIPPQKKPTNVYVPKPVQFGSVTPEENAKLDVEL